MIPSQITESVLALPENDRLELARRIVESVATDRRVSELVTEGVRRIEDIVTGRAPGLSEEDFRRAIG
jgi:putative addiction module component (TIGR02574 family)